MWKRSCRVKRSFRDFAQKGKWKIWKRSFRARLPSKNQTLTCEHQAWTGSSTARPIRAWSAPSRTCSATFARQTPIYLPRYILSCKTQHSVHPLSLKNAFYVRLPRNLPVDDVKTKLSCETSLRNWKLKMRKQSFCDFAQKVKVEDMKTKLSCETSFQNSNFNLRKSSLN